MKHILNNLTEQEKNAIREQHTGGMKVMTEKFSRLTNSKLGDSKPLVNEQTALGAVGNSLEIQGQLGNFLLQTLPITQIYNMVKSASSGDAKTFNQVLDQEKTRLGQNYQTLKNAVTQGDISKTLGNVATGLSGLLGPYVDQMKSGFGNKQQPVSTGGGGRLPKTGNKQQPVSTGGGRRLPKTGMNEIGEQAQTYTTKGTNTGGQQYDITSPFKVGQTIKGKRSIDGQIYTITVAQVGQGFIGGKIMGPGTYNNKPLDGKFPWELNTNTPGVLHGNNEMGTFTIVK